MRKQNLLALLLLGVTVCGSQAAEVSKDPIVLLEAAKAGKASAQLEYAKTIYKKSEKEAFEWAQKAADQGSGEAWFWMGNNFRGNPAPYFVKAAEL